MANTPFVGDCVIDVLNAEIEAQRIVIETLKAENEALTLQSSQHTNIIDDEHEEFIIVSDLESKIVLSTNRESVALTHMATVKACGGAASMWRMVM